MFTANTNHKVKVIYLQDVSNLQDGTPQARKTCKWSIKGNTWPIHLNTLDNTKQSQDR